ncbi:MAG TPA: hypothetical protein VII06_32490 [Chloroflexota bacterium]|jgi:hypothetical protein
MKHAAFLTLILLVTSWLGSGSLAHAQDTPTFNEDAIKQLVRDANSDAYYSVAYRTGNTDVLSETWGGEALLTIQEDIAAMRFGGQYIDPQLEDMEFDHIEELGPGRVRVVTTESWLARLYQIGGNYLGYQRQVVENRYLVVRDGDAWHIIEADQDIEGGDPVFRPGEPDQAQ